MPLECSLRIRDLAMADIFVSYKRENQESVRRIVEGLRAKGLTVWWDPDIMPGAPWEATIESELKAARAVVVAWSAAAVASDNVKAEARYALKQGQLIQVFVEPCDPPLFFGERQGVDLSQWCGATHDDRFQAVRAAVDAILHAPVAAGAHKPKPPQGAAAVWERMRTSEDVDDLGFFIETFPGTVEALEARRRVRLLNLVIPIRETDSLLEIGCRFDDDDDEHVGALFSHLEKIDEFLDQWPESEWESEVQRARSSVCDELNFIGVHQAKDGSIYCYGMYMQERSWLRKPAR